MTTTLQTDPRRTARDAFRKPGRPPLEMPVLFQLADMSVHHGKLAPPGPTQVVAPVAEPVIVAPPTPIVELALAKVPQEVDPPTKETPTIAATEVDTPVLEILTAQPQPEPVVPQAVVEATKTDDFMGVELKAEAPTPEAEEPSTEVAAIPTAGSEASVTDVTPPAEATAPSPRDRTEQRTRNRQPASGHSEWMRTHGKYIAVVFVFALIATIYLAQNGDEPSPANPNAASSTSAEAAANTPGESETKVTDAHSAKESVPVALHNHSPSLLDESSPALGNPAAEAHAHLHAPQGGHTIKEPAQPTEVADSKSLFPWQEAGQTRIASKPEDGRAKPQAESTLKGPNAEVREEAPKGESLVEETPSIYGPPGHQIDPANEQTSGEGPQLNGPSGYPTTNPNRFREFEPPTSRTAPAQPPVTSQRATPASYQPGSPNIAPPSRTSGPRYERTGSGLY
ncbi:MAG: hypothetical protein IAF94_16360 [Pirellulaceae bacterium]|nr:hypothetical protein [Pirellulaceae bacterium]